MTICAPEQTLCSSVCVSLQSDVNNCGACGRTCTASEVCQAGTCFAGGCSSGLNGCGAGGHSCVDNRSDPNFCGSCGNRCDQTEVCAPFLNPADARTAQG